RLINLDPSSLSPNPQSTSFRYRGYLRVPLRGRYRFTAEGEGELTFSIHGAPVLSGAGVLSRLPVAEAELQGGDNRIEVAFRPTGKPGPPFRLLWSSEEFAP